jgi:hypothetical protein
MVNKAAGNRTLKVKRLSFKKEIKNHSSQNGLNTIERG